MLFVYPKSEQKKALKQIVEEWSDEK